MRNSWCPFCQIVARQAPATIYYEDDHVIAIKPLDEVVPGHSLVIPRQHTRSIFTISPEQLSRVAVGTKHVADLLRTNHHAMGVNVLHASGAAAQQSVDHFHAHVVPRHPDDGLDLWIKQRL